MIAKEFAMRPLVFLSAVFLCSANASAQAHFAKWASDRNTSADDLIRGISQTDEPGAAQSAYRILFDKIGADGVHKLLTNKSDTIALRAAWEEVDLTVPEQEPPAAVRPDRHKLDWFVGYLDSSSSASPRPDSTSKAFEPMTARAFSGFPTGFNCLVAQSKSLAARTQVSHAAIARTGDLR